MALYRIVKGSKKPNTEADFHVIYKSSQGNIHKGVSEYSFKYGWVIHGLGNEVVEWLEPIEPSPDIQKRAEELFPPTNRYDDSDMIELFGPSVDLNEHHRNKAIQLATEAVAMKDAEIGRLKGLLKEIDKSLYVGEGLDDTDILKWYVDVVSVIKDEIKQLLNTPTRETNGVADWLKKLYDSGDITVDIYELLSTDAEAYFKK